MKVLPKMLIYSSSWDSWKKEAIEEEGWKAKEGRLGGGGRERGREEGRKEGAKELTYGPEPQQVREAIEPKHWSQLIGNSISDSNFNDL